jgi:hypothetical protein
MKHINSFAKGDELGEIIKEKLIARKICERTDIECLNQKLKITHLNNFSGAFFQKDNCCFVRYFKEMPDLVAVICEYEYNDTIYDVKDVESFLKMHLKEIGFTPINIYN